MATKRLIDANEVIRQLEQDKELFLDGWGGFSSLPPKDKARVDELDNCISRLFNASTVDAVEVVHSFWDDSGRYVFPSGRKAICCDICKCALSVGEYNRFKWNYCPVCGAKMDGDGND